MSRRPTAQDSRYHCNLNVWGDDDAPIWPALLPRRRQRMRVWDRDTPANLQAVAGLQRNGLMLAGVPWRFQGVMSTLGHVRGEQLLAHVEWLLSNLQPGFRLCDWQAQGLKCELSFAWGGGAGTAHGPVIVPALAELLALHKVQLGISIYA